MYLKHYNLTRRPFSITPDPHFLYMSARHKEALAHLLFGLGEGGGFVQLTGEVGTGKTTICRCLLEQVPENVDIAMVLNPKVTASELIATVCDDLGIKYPADYSIKTLTDVLNEYLLDAYQRGRRTVLIVDEAQNLGVDVLEQVRLLTNLETSTRKLLQIVLIGQPELRSLLASNEMRQLSQRITARYHLDPISREETDAYIKHRLQICGNSRSLFSRRVVNRIHKLAGGVPRLINVLCDRALLGAFVEGKTQVDMKVLKKAAREVINETRPSGGHRQVPWLLGILAAVLAVIALLVYRPFQDAGTRVVEPVAQVGGQLAASDGPAEAGVTEPVSVDEPASVPEPVVVTEPEPVVVTEPEPVVVTEPEPVVVTEPEPVVVTEPEPVSVTEPEPVPATEPEPVPVVPVTEPQPALAPEPAPELPDDIEAGPDRLAYENPARAFAALLMLADSSYERNAWRELFAFWSVAMPAETGSGFCEFAKQYGLLCLREQGNWNTLRQLDRPAILRLVATDGSRIPAVLQYLDNKYAELIVGEELYRLEIVQIDPFWYGEYSLLMQPPPGGKLFLREGFQAEDVQWLRRQLETVQGVEIPASNPLLFDQALKQHLLDFQRSRGLVADGVMGKNTIIHLNSQSSPADIPRLSTGQS